MEDIDIKELFYVFMKNIGVIVIVAVLFAALGLLYTSFMVTPMYKSSTSLVLSKSTNSGNNTDNNTSITQSDLLLNQKLVSTYSEIIKSRTIVNEVINKLNLKIDVDNLTKRISVSSKKDTELLEITVSYTDAKLAADIANSLAEVFKTKVKEVYNIDNVSVIDVAEVNDEPYNISMAKTSIMFSVVGIIIVCAVLFLRMYFNNTINSAEDVERLLDIPVLAIVPKCED